MAESLIGKYVYVCNCGPKCRCGYRSWFPSHCPCRNYESPAARRRILAEDLTAFYVSQTGAGVEASDELGDKPLTSANGEPLQKFAKQWQPKKPLKLGVHSIRYTVTDSLARVEVDGKTWYALRADEGWVGVHRAERYPSLDHFAVAVVDSLGGAPLRLQWPLRPPA